VALRREAPAAAAAAAASAGGVCTGQQPVVGTSTHNTRLARAGQQHRHKVQQQHL